MSNGYNRALADMLLPRLDATRTQEASKLVLASVKAGRALSDAVLDVIEELPVTKTKRLRAWASQIDGYHAWQQLEDKGWKFSPRWRGFWSHPDDRFFLCSPDFDEHNPPPDDAAEAVARAARVRLIDVDHGKFLYAVVRSI